ncbi:hypothetical protein D3C71_581570 [compost metagenome]
MHLACQVHDSFRGRVLPHHAAQVEVVFQGVALALLGHHALAQRAVGLSQLQQVLHAGDQAPVIPWLGQVVGRAGLDQVDGRIELGPCRQQDHGQIRVACADRVEQRAAFLARRGVGREVHVLHHQVDGVAIEQLQALFGRGGAHGVDLVQGEQHVQRDGHGGIVVNNQYGRHARSISLRCRLRYCGWQWPAKCWPRAMPGRTRRSHPAARTRARRPADSRAAGAPFPAG